MNGKTVDSTKTRLAQIMTPNDANVLGKVFGGSILALIDLCASATSSKYAETVCVTASFDRVDFHEPIEIGELVELEGFVSFVGRTSMEITIDVKATNLLVGKTRHSNTARVTMVALKDGRPMEVPRLICESRDDKERFLLGLVRRERRSQSLDVIKSLTERLNAVEEDLIDQLIADPTQREHFLGEQP